jgi:hypothetical protein
MAPTPKSPPMPAKVSLAPHLPRPPRSLGLGLESRRSAVLGGEALPPPCQEAMALTGSEATAPSAPGWARQALRESLLATLVTTLLTSAVWAAPEAFRQSPARTWAQMITPALAAGQGSAPGVLIDCP